MHLDSHSYDFVPTNTLLSAFSGLLALVSSLDPLVTVGLPVAFFVIGKFIDVGVRIWLEKRKRK